MMIGSHNSWTYLKPRKWWMRLISWTARCQKLDIQQQYDAGARCFDLRIKVIDKRLAVAHGLVIYDIDRIGLMDYLWQLNQKGDCMVRVLHEVRNEKELNMEKLTLFRKTCESLESAFPHIKFFCGRNLVNWHVDYEFANPEPTIEDAYGSVQSGWYGKVWPWLWAKVHNKNRRDKRTEKM